jgi:alkaline phosphatase
MHRAVCRFVFAVLTVMAGGSCSAQTIYPLTKAEILSGARFDLKVEFPDAPVAAGVKVTINGQPAEAVLGKAPQIIEKEDGGPSTAYWIKGASLAQPGSYTVDAEAGGAKSSVQWTVFGTANGPKARNVILFVGDGLSIDHRTAARILSKGIAEGRYGGEMAIDDMPHMALVSTPGSDSIITDSANSATAYTTGHKTCVNALGVYCAKNRANTEHPSFETIAELIKRKSKRAIGIVTNTEIEDATPAAMVAHTRSRNDLDDIVGMYFNVKPEVILGGGTTNFMPRPIEQRPGQTTRHDDQDFIAKFTGDGYAYATTKAELLAKAQQPGTRRLLGLFNTGSIDGALDRRVLKKGTVAKFPDQPDLTDQITAALDVLKRNDDGFMLMVESGRIDKYSHSLDWERAVYDTIMLDNAVKVAKDFAAGRNDTLIIVVADHGHPVSIIGTYDDEAPGPLLRDKLMVYDKARFPNYPKPDADGYPSSVDVSRRLAFVFAAFPDHCETGKPHVAGEYQPAIIGADGKSYVANEDNCQATAVRRPGNLPFTAQSGVHAGDDVVLTAAGPGAEMFHGRIDNTYVFRVMATALGLGQ